MVKKLISFDCGCKWYADTDDNGNIISVDYNPLDAPLGCKKTWNMVGDGLSLGVFQLETSWGQSIARKVKPRNIDEFSQLIAIMRPGTSDAVVDGKTLTNHYIDRKFEREESIPLVPELKNITADTYHILCFQEQIMKASQELAGFTGIEARELQKAIGKKKPEVMAAIKTKFVQGCINHSRMDRESAERVFDVIEANQRYSFNLSHSISYSLNSYYFSAYPKAHFPKAFFVAQMEFCDDYDDMRDFIYDAKTFNITVEKPDLRNKNINFMIRGKSILYGLSHLKYIGETTLRSLIEYIKDIDLSNIGFAELLIKYLYKNIDSRSIESLIKSGSMDFLGIDRLYMLHQLQVLTKLNDTQYAFCKMHVDKNTRLIDLLKSIQDLGIGKFMPCKTKASMNKLNDIINLATNPGSALTDTPEICCKFERDVTGFEFSLKIKKDGIQTNTDCYQLKKSQLNISKKPKTLAVKIIDIRKFATTTIIDVADESGFIGGIFLNNSLVTKRYTEIQKNNYILMKCAISGKGGIFVNDIQQLRI